ncbi:MAG: anthranilate synthase component I family protein [Actinomycetota bacterium]|nr:anthranilate synthase component I family protein [Actinomycetota bacterium]
MKILSTISAVNLKIQPQDAAYILRDTDYMCFLDSSLAGSKYSKFSYIAWNPKMVIKSRGFRNEFLNIYSGIGYHSYQNPLSFLKQNIREYIYCFPGGDTKNIRFKYIDKGRIVRIKKSIGEKLPDFRGGFMGYFSYDLKNHIEMLPHNAVDDIGIPLFYLTYYDRLLAYSRREEKWYFIRNFPLREGRRQNKKDRVPEYIPMSLYDEDDYMDSRTNDVDLIGKINSSVSEICSFFREGSKKSGRIKKDIIKKYYDKNIPGIKLNSNISKRDYVKRVLKIKEYIHKGHIYQANFSQRFKAHLPVEPMDLYYILRAKNSAPFSGFLKFPDFSIGSSSPERFLFLKGDLIQTRPIKGTRPRGRDTRDDYKNIKELKESIKDRAELNMIVDLERNDLGKFCYYGSVNVSEHAVIEKYARVFHSVSTVVGKVKKGVDISDVLKASFPGGSITGTPKIRAMEIIDEMESAARGVYAGSIGYIGIDSTVDLNIVIRTFVIKKNKFYYNVGGGIVEDSVPIEEYAESLDKGIALEETLKFFTGRNLKKLL